MITIEKIGERFTCLATPPHVTFEWTSKEPMTVPALVEALRGKGVHQTDIGDAFYSADPTWIAKNSQVK